MGLVIWAWYGISIWHGMGYGRLSLLQGGCVFATSLSDSLRMPAYPVNLPTIGVEFVRIQAGLAYQFSRKASSRWMYNCLVRLTWMRLDFCRLSWGRFWWWLFVERRHVCLPATTILMSITSYWDLGGMLGQHRQSSQFYALRGLV